MNQGLRHKILRAVARGRHAVRRRVRPGYRWPVGFLLVLFGLLGFLPVLGFWMVPLGIAVAAMDIRPLWRRLQTARASKTVEHVPDFAVKEKPDESDRAR